MVEYKSREQIEAGRKNVPRIKLPLGFGYLEAPLNHLINRLDIAEEREIRIEEALKRIEAALRALTEADPAT